VIVLSDSSPLITLTEIGYLETLARLYGRIIITSNVYGEVVVTGEGLPGANQITDAPWIRVMPTDKPEYSRPRLGAGESSTITLAIEMNADLVLMDARQARKAAEAEGLVVFGSVGVLETAFRKGFLSDLTAAYRRLLASAAYINPDILRASLVRLKQPGL
jgi:predicted nucleic acid-binding protein